MKARHSLHRITTLIALSLLIHPVILRGVEVVEFLMLGDLPNGTQFNNAYAVNSDGTVVAGSAVKTFAPGTSTPIHAFWWEEKTGMVQVYEPTSEDYFENANGISDDGNILVGNGEVSDSRAAVKWDSINGLVDLGKLSEGRPTAISEAFGISGDGTHIVGSYSVDDALNEPDTVEAFLWDAVNGMIGLGDLPGGLHWSVARDVSSDGSIVVGSGNTGDSGSSEAFRWDTVNGMVGLGFLVEAEEAVSSAQGISDEGTVIVGWSSSTEEEEAFIWTTENGMVVLEDLPGGLKKSKASDISGDGSVIVGYGSSDAGTEAVMWRREDGHMPTSLHAILDAHGIDREGISLLSASAVSRDGSTIVGQADISPGGFEAYLLRIHEYPGWGGYPVMNELMDTDTGDWMGWINVWHDPSIWSYAIESWMYMPEPEEEAGGAWAYLYK